MLWRRGGGAYRPLVALNAPIARLESDADWDDYELEDTHFKWSAEDGQDPRRRRELIEAMVSDLWDSAAHWTRSRGEWCDFQLLGFGAEGTILFEDGKRCSIADEGEEDLGPTQTPPSAEESTEPRASRREIDRRTDRRIDDLLNRLAEERDKSATNARQSLDAAKEAIEATPRLFSQAREVLRETIDYQREQFEHMRDQRTGRFEAQAKVLAEMEQTKRTHDIVELVRHGWESALGNLVPFADRLFEYLGDRKFAVFPEFKCAQQAIVYLVLTITPHQLTLLWGDKDGAARAMMVVLDTASKLAAERDALEHMTAIIRVLRSERFRDIATPEQQLAARYIIGRLALYKINEYGNADETQNEPV